MSIYIYIRVSQKKQVLIIQLSPVKKFLSGHRRLCEKYWVI